MDKAFPILVVEDDPIHRTLLCKRLTEAGHDFLPVLFAIGAWGRKHRGGGKVTRFFDAENGTEIDPLTIDRATGAPIGTRSIRIAAVE